MVQAHIFFSGMVQGVGFRYTVHRYATGLNIVGWVRNLSDGRVEACVEGPKDKIEQMCESVANHFGGYLRDKEITYKDPTGKFSDFQITSNG